jgi:hypothetical protein
VVVVFVPYYKYSAVYHLEGLPPPCILRPMPGEQANVVKRL